MPKRKYASADAAETITDGYDDVPYWCRLSTRKQSGKEPQYAGDVRHAVVRFEYDWHVSHTQSKDFRYT